MNRKVASSCLVLPLILVVLACNGPLSGNGPLSVGARVETFSYFDDGLRLRLAPDSGAGVTCVGANVHWVGSSVYITLVTVPVNANVEVSHPSYLSANGWRYVFIPEEHIAQGAWVTEYLDDGDGMQKLGGHERNVESGPFPH